MPVSSALAAAVITNTPSGKRRQATSGIVEHAASTTQTRLSSTDPSREARMALCKTASEPTNRAAASAASRSAPELGPTANGLCAVADDDIALKVYLPHALLASPWRGI